MEVPDGGGEGSCEKTMMGVTPESGEKPGKRKMKTAFQLELLEKTYALAAYPSEAVRADLSVKLGLTDRQLQMWFCHRRLKDRKARESGAQVAVAASGTDPGSSPRPEPRKALARMSAPGVPRTGPEMLPANCGYFGVVPSPRQTMLEVRAVAFVESQLGERIREDGPILGVEFDPLPPGAFGAPIETTMQQKHPARSYVGKLFERHEAHDLMPTKTSAFLSSTEHGSLPSSSCAKRRALLGDGHVGQSQKTSRTLHEYQFLPEQPCVRSDAYERLAPSHFYDPSVEASGNMVSPFQSGRTFLHANERAAPGYTYEDQMTNAGFLPHQGMDAPFGAHHVMGIESPFLSFDRTGHEDAVRNERKRKSEEARIVKEDEAYKKRMKKELEKQEILRKKREEQQRREMERHDRERKKEEERMMREKQRELKRFHREQRRENERMEKFLQRENRRAEKLKLKEEMRRERKAARVKAAKERAAARRIAREYTDLIEDERLELMELAASSKGLPSITSLDSGILQNLDLFRDMLTAFPPKEVRLKRPFAVQPWADSEENIGNLLMVWRFLITFADVLSLWPFTLDEFIQALHDYDSRLLGEVHISLLRSIIKDVEDVARTPTFAPGVNQNSAANPGGGHPQIVEGAYVWGFDILSWQSHLSPLTWPEILRQLALSAGFGPQLKKRTVERVYYREDNEGHDAENIISTLRNGVAAENAAVSMKRKGFSYLRRSRHLLTPGTVKYAAFHVLSLEGSKGLTILEVADKIQKSGLRDLTTSKTPEASIGAALSRDTKLFERTAPSTYCVRPAFRRDPADAEAILAAAREKIHIFDNGLSDPEEAEKDTEYAERDEDSDSDSADDPEVDDTIAEDNLDKDFSGKNDVNVVKLSKCSGKGKEEILGDHVNTVPQSGPGSVGNAFSSIPLEDSKDANILAAPSGCSLDLASNSHGVINADVEDMEIDESSSGEPWVQGLMEGEYSDLSVEERLNALVSLIGVAIEGNSIHAVLEERLEAANALKKQMWAEDQLDKRRMKEAYLTKIQALGTQANTAMGRSPELGVDNKSSDVNVYSAINNEPLVQENPNNVNNLATDGNLMGQEISVYPDSTLPPQNGCIPEKSRSQFKLYISHRAEEMYVYRSLPLGQDRRRSRYWQFVTSASRNDPGSGRIFFESRDGFWRLIDSEEAFDSLLAALDTRGIRESHLHSMLQRIESSFKAAIRRKTCSTDTGDQNLALKMEATEMALSPDCSKGIDSPRSVVCGLASDTSEQSTSFRIELGQNKTESHAAFKRYQDFQNWLWKECFNSTVLCAMKYGKKRCLELLGTCCICYKSYFSEEKHCSSCHKTLKTLHNGDASFSEHVVLCEGKRKIDLMWNLDSSESSLPMRLQMVKALLTLIEVSIPSEALQAFWTEDYRKSWGVKLQSSLSTEDMLQMLTLLEGAIKRDYLSSTFETTDELLNPSMHSDFAVENSRTHSGTVPVLPWIPRTTAAVALRLLNLDASISYMMHQKDDSHKDMEAGGFIKLPSRYAVVKDNPELEPMETPERAEYQPEVNWAITGIRRNHVSGRGRRGRGGRGRGSAGRGARGGASLARSQFNEEVWNAELTAQTQRKRGRPPGRGHKRGRRSVRPRHKPESRLSPIERDFQLDSYHANTRPRMNGLREHPRSSEREEWDVEESNTVYAEHDDNCAGPSGSEDNVQTSGDEYDDQVADTRQYGIKPTAFMDDESSEDDVDREGNGIEEEDGDYVNEDIEDDNDDDAEIIGDEYGEEDEGMASFSSEYSD